MSKSKKSPKRSPRSYTPTTVSAASHPTRQAILNRLKSNSATTVDLEEETGETRYNLYHHLMVLEKNGLIRHQLKGRVKEYKLVTSKRPPAAYYQVHTNDMFTDREKFSRFLDALSDLVGEKIPGEGEVLTVNVTITYPWTKE
jgi:DNA-binding transcriptional ArsR family regulator